MTKIKYVDGNAIEPQGDGLKFILHIVNDIGGWGAGFVVAISNKWKRPEKFYRSWYNIGNYTVKSQATRFVLGQIQEVIVEEEISIINMIGQRSTGGEQIGDRFFNPIRYEAIDECLARVAVLAKKNKASIHMPRIGCGLAKGKWDKIEPLIVNNLTSKNIDVTVYDYTP